MYHIYHTHNCHNLYLTKHNMCMCRIFSTVTIETLPFSSVCFQDQGWLHPHHCAHDHQVPRNDARRDAARMYKGSSWRWLNWREEEDREEVGLHDKDCQGLQDCQIGQGWECSREHQIQPHGHGVPVLGWPPRRHLLPCYCCQCIQEGNQPGGIPAQDWCTQEKGPPQSS